MLNTIFGIVGWIGTLLVFAGVAIRVFRPRVGSVRVLGRGRRPGLRRLLHADPVARNRPLVPEARNEARRDDEHQRHRGARDSHRRQLGCDRRDKRWDLTAAASYTLSDQTVKVLSNLKTPVKVLVFDAARRLPALPRLRSRCTRTPARTSRSSMSTWIASRLARANTHRLSRHGRHGVRRPPRKGDERARAGPDEQPDQGHDRTAGEGVFRPGPRRARHRGQRPSRLRQRRRCC